MTQPTPGLTALLDGLIDYAGMFPPARLSLEDALANYLHDIRGPDAWMLSGFVLPTTRMSDAADILENTEAPGTLNFSALGRSGAQWDSFFEGLAADIDAIESFRGRLKNRVDVRVIETRLPGEDLEYQIRSDALVQKASEITSAAGLLPYFEVPFDEHWEARARRAIVSIRDSAGNVRFKIRTGGVVLEAFPSPARLAWGMLEAAGQGVPYKCTAGLHHPIRQFDPETGAMMHGFTNVFAGAILAAVHSLDIAGLEKILSEEDPDAFHFDKDGLSWKSLNATTEQIRLHRNDQVVSIGSCSFDDPRHDMKKLGWLE